MDACTLLYIHLSLSPFTACIYLDIHLRYMYLYCTCTYVYLKCMNLKRLFSITCSIRSLLLATNYDSTTNRHSQFNSTTDCIDIISLLQVQVFFMYMYIVYIIDILHIYVYISIILPFCSL